LPNISNVGFRVFSQNDEDGILFYLFSILGTMSKFCLDIAFASPYGANTTNLLCNHGWQGLLVCGSKKEKTFAKKFFTSHPDTIIYPPKIISQWVTIENINEILLKNNVPKNIDLLSLDVDGVDYWIWKNLEVVQPRVVVLEYHNIWGSKKAVTIPYKADFNRFDVHEDYMGASLQAFVKLAKVKGYRLVGCNKYCFNAFFVKHGHGEDLLPEIPSKNCFSHIQAKEGIKNRLPAIENLEWKEV
jgi:hypothetical protein